MSRDRTLEIWHIPKRGSIHQIIGALNVIKAFDIDGKGWPGTIRKLFDQKFAMWGFTSRGRSLSKNASETLEALIKYLGLLVIDKDRKLRITPAGHALLKEHPFREPEKKKKPLKDTEKEMGDIHSLVLRNQMMKLILTNPSILHYCQNLKVSPFRETLLLLMDEEIEYLSPEEMAMFLFVMKGKSERERVKNQIIQFRKHNETEKKKVIQEFIKTPEGNITLNQAPTATYWRQLCLNTGLFRVENQKLYLKDDCTSEAKELIAEYQDSIYDFEDNLPLWYEYYTVPQRKKQPFDIKIRLKGKGTTEYLLMVLKDEVLISGSIITKGNQLEIPVFTNENHKIRLIDLQTGEKILEIAKTFSLKEGLIELDVPDKGEPEVNTKFYADRINELIESQDFDRDYSRHLKIISSHLGEDFLAVKHRAWLRGGRLEFLFYRLLQLIQQEGKIDKLNWNGSVNDFGIPRPAPGLRQGLPDLSFKCGSEYFLLELTTIKAASTQWSAEGSSVPFHIRNYINNTGIKEVIGIFAPPLYHKKVDDALKNTLIPYKYTIICMPISEFVKLVCEEKNLNLRLKHIISKQYKN